MSSGGSLLSSSRGTHLAIERLRIEQRVVVEQALLRGGRDRLVMPAPARGELHRLRSRSLRQHLVAVRPFLVREVAQFAAEEFARAHQRRQLLDLLQLHFVDDQPLRMRRQRLSEPRRAATE